MIYLIILITSFFTEPAESFCSCLPPGEITTEEYKSYDIILHGKIEAAREEGRKMVYTIRVKKFYKGVGNKDFIEIDSFLEPSMCGIGFVPGDKWLIYAYKTDEGYFTDLCTRSKIIGREENAAELRKDLEFLVKSLELRAQKISGSKRGG
ncbi:hypothetical protein [Gramella sp. KN1008]|uniref:hypothetical protein n=1 Tax=Gramella sp. KN1008 TaxID=2529298 RepID=UPI00103C94DF|nr:hypothetical protein [Gramella sp. KN1008]TBW27131.1 hypothetical protein EZJ28_12545 [Gramella sp. KN1008]